MKRIAVFLLLLFSLDSAFALTAYEMVKKSEYLVRGNTNQGILEMTIATPYFTRTLKMHIWNKGLKKTFVRIFSPAKEAGIGSLKMGDEMWNYLPAIEKIIKIPPSMMMSAWMGSDFSNDDVVKESSIVEDYNHRILTEERLSGYDAYKIECIPKENAPVVWGKIYFWLRKSDHLPLKQEYYDEKGKLIKVLESIEVGSMGGRVIPILSEMRTIGKENSKTTLRVREMSFDVSIADSVFTLRHLQTLRAKE